MTYHGKSVTSPGGLFTAEVLIAGTPQPVFTAADGYPYVPGEPGQACQVRVRLLVSGRAEAALSVDGRDALDDQPASLAHAHGLVFTGEYTFRGFRIDDTRVREFEFGAVTGSVTDQAGTPGNAGVIGLAAWREQPALSYASTDMRGPGYQPRSVSAVSYAGPGLGMHVGETRHDPVGRTHFTRQGSPDVLAIGYDTLAALEAMGITRTRPDPWPGRTTGYENYLA